MAKVLVVMFAFLGLGSCAGPEIPKQLTGQQSETSESCAAKGQFLDHFGMFGSPICVTRYADSGKVCRSKSDCLGRCVVQLGTAETRYEDFKIGVETEGKCARQDALEGCYSIVEDGKVTDSICED